MKPLVIPEDKILVEYAPGKHRLEKRIPEQLASGASYRKKVRWAQEMLEKELGPQEAAGGPRAYSRPFSGGSPPPAGPERDGLLGSLKSSRIPKAPNKTENRYRTERLLPMYPDFAIHYEAIKLRLADGTWYIPDFLVAPIHVGQRLELHEVKAPHRFAEKGMLKWKWAKEKYGHIFRFVFAMWRDGKWEIKE